MKRAFVRYVSHEIRTPLSIVTMGLKLLETDYKHRLESTEEEPTTDLNNNSNNDNDDIVIATSSKRNTRINSMSGKGFLLSQDPSPITPPTLHPTILHASFDSGIHTPTADLSRRSSFADAANIEYPSVTLELVRDMRDSSETAVNILNDLLLYEKIESNLLTIESNRVGLHNVLSDVVNMFKIQVNFPLI